MKQIQQPTRVQDLGVGWFICLIGHFAGQSHRTELDQALATPIIVRLAAGCTLMVGIGMIILTIATWLVLWAL
ncbi:MAG: hypothetical protein ACO1HP_05415 [Bacteroidota bacterium]